MNPYEGSPSLAQDAREKVLQTFRHTLQLVRDGRNEEALLGCDFILKMDSRFAPAHRLLASLRGVPAGQRVDIVPFASHLEAATPAPAPPPPPQETPGPFEAEAAAAPPPPAPAPAGGLDDLVFDDYGPGGAAGRAAPPPGAASIAETSFAGLSETPRPAASPAPPPESPGGAAPASSEPPQVFEELDLSVATGHAPGSPSAAPARPPAGAPPSALRPAPAAEPSGASLDPRIAQFLKQGDEAMARGNAQEAIDLWSRVFLIDLSNEEASRRIDGAREALADSARKVDVLLADGVQLYEAGNLQAARAKFLDVLAFSEHDATARPYLNQIDAAMAAPGAPAAAQGDSEFLRTEIEAPTLPSYADDGEGSLDPGRTLAVVVPDEAAPAVAKKVVPAPSRRRAPLDLRVLLPAGVVVLALIAAGAWWFFRGRRPAAPGGESKGPPASTAGGEPAAKRRPAGEDPFSRAQELYAQGKVDAAVQTLLAVPDNDPRHNEALTKIDQFRNASVPTPAPTAPNLATLEELRAQGFAALKASKYIEAFKALDPVVKARPEDAEAQQALRRAREAVDGLRSAVKSYSEGDYESAIKLLWQLRKTDAKNQDVEEYLVNSYVNSGIQALQSGNSARAVEALQDAVRIRSSDIEAQRLLKFARKYPKGATDLMARIFVRYLSPRP
jgi:tetratricopeptide (TPR) repeat protein